VCGFESIPKSAFMDKMIIASLSQIVAFLEDKSRQTWCYTLLSMTFADAGRADHALD